MDALLSVANWLLPLVYLALAIDYGATFILRIRTHARNPGVILAIALHAGFLVLWGSRFGRPPLAGSYEILSVIALASAMVYWVMELAGGDRRAGVFVFLLIFLLQYTSSSALAGAISPLSASDGDVQHTWGRLHVIPASLAYAALAFAAVYGLLYLVGRRNLKKHRFGLLFDRLPPLELLGTMSGYALLGGFVLMTVTIVTGSMVFGHSGYAEQHPALEPKVAAKIIIGSLAWCICGVAVFGKFVLKWSTPRVSGIAVAGFLAIAALLAASIALS